ncbi:MAG: HEPN domain-containing protein [Anaerolineales bacterium]|nr:HEPN domain-containing protein [Anaerolineales bacterium]
MKDSSRQLLEKAEHSIAAADTLLKSGYIDFAAGRAYYAMFYIAEALLNEKDLRFSKHGGVHSAFGEHFVKTGLFDPKYHRWLLDAFDQRIVGDYGLDMAITIDQVQGMLIQARSFLQEAVRLLGIVE